MSKGVPGMAGSIAMVVGGGQLMVRAGGAAPKIPSPSRKVGDVGDLPHIKRQSRVPNGTRLTDVLCRPFTGLT
jgi:hypothetical protein